MMISTAYFPDALTSTIKSKSFDELNAHLMWLKIAQGDKDWFAKRILERVQTKRLQSLESLEAIDQNNSGKSI